jgi:hypothetical protein
MYTDVFFKAKINESLLKKKQVFPTSVSIFLSDLSDALSTKANGLLL